MNLLNVYVWKTNLDFLSSIYIFEFPQVQPSMYAGNLGGNI